MDSVKQKIAKLLALARNEGVAENEAATALRHANALMARHNIELVDMVCNQAQTEIEFRSTFVPVQSGIFSRSIPEYWQVLAVGVSIFTDTVVKIAGSETEGIGVTLAGECQDVAFAEWLLPYFDSCVLKAVRQRHLLANMAARYKLAMSAALQARMASLRAERDKTMVDTGNGFAVAVVSRKLILAAQGSDIGESQTVEVSADAQCAADSIGLNRPIGYASEEVQAIANNAPRLLH